MASMQGMQKILYVGTKIDIKEYPVLAHLPWRCIFTTSSDENLAEVFSIVDERQVKSISTKDEYDKSGNKLDKKNPLLVFINGFDSRTEDPADLDAEVERDKNRNGLKDSLGIVLKSELMVELTIVGYNPTDSKEISPKELYYLLNTLSDNRLVFYGLSESEENDKFISGLVKKGIATVFSQDLGQVLEEINTSINTSVDEDIPEAQTSSDLKNTVYINEVPVILNQSLCYDFSKYGRILTVAEMYPGTITPAMQVDFFYQFLKRSTNAPQWYGYARRNGFAVKRDYENELYRLVIEGLETNSDIPIILSGQSSSGKSIALGALAYRIFQEHKHPVLFINNPDVTFAAGSPATFALDNILKEIRDLGGQALVILDWSLYSIRNNAIRSISDTCYNRGQKVLFVASAMNVPGNDSRYKIVKAPISLSEREKKAFRDLIVQKGKLPQNRVEQWMRKLDRDPGLLALLYTLVYDLHPQLEMGIRQEISKALADTEESILGLEAPVPMKREMTAMAAQLAKFFPVSQMNSDEIAPNIKQQIIESLQLFSESVAVASLFKLRMPLTMALHLLNIPECQNRQSYRDVVLNAPWLVYAMDTDKYAPGEYYVEFRAPIDAKIYLASINKSKPDMLCIVAEMIRTLKKDKDSFYSSEVRFLERLIRMVGPNSDDPNVKEGWYSSYGKGCDNIIDALGELRDSEIVEPLLIAQEITYIREYYGNDSQPDLALRINWLQKAIRIARGILDLEERPNAEATGWNKGLIDSITVESIFAELQLERFYSLAKEEQIVFDKSNALTLCSYTTRSEKLFEVINGQPENSYAYTALLSCFLAQYENAIYSGKIDSETFKNMSDVLEIVDMTAASIPAVEQNEYYQKSKDAFLRVFDEACGCGRTEKYFNELLKMGSAVGVYIKATRILRDANIKYNESLDKSAEGACKRALALLENDEYESVVCTHAASQYMRIQLTWLCYNKKPLFHHERQTTHLTENQWAHLCDLCRSFKINIIERQPECSNRARVFYIMALAYAQLGDYGEAIRAWQAVHESDFYDTGRLITWHVLCKPDGAPKLFTGTFNRSTVQDQRIYIKEMQRAVFYRSLQSINKSETSGDASDLCIGTSFRGFRAFAKNRETMRD